MLFHKRYLKVGTNMFFLQFHKFCNNKHIMLFPTKRYKKQTGTLKCISEVHRYRQILEYSGKIGIGERKLRKVKKYM